MRLRRTFSGLLDAQAGCFDCHGDETHWYGKNAMAVAARHHDATGHVVWAEQTIRVTYGDWDTHPYNPKRKKQDEV